MNLQTRAPCTAPGCERSTRAASQRCQDHRPRITVTAVAGFIKFDPPPTSLSHAEALRLADDIVDTIERATTT